MNLYHYRKGLIIILALFLSWNINDLFAQDELLEIQADSCLNDQEVRVRILSSQDYSSRGGVTDLSLSINYDTDGLTFNSLDNNISGLILSVNQVEDGEILISVLTPFGSASALSEETLVVSLFFRCINCGGYNSEIRLKPDSWIAFENADTLFFGGQGTVETLCPNYPTIESDTILCAGSTYEGMEIIEDTILELENPDDCGCIQQELVNITAVDLPEWDYDQIALDCDEGSSLITLDELDSIGIEQVFWEDGTTGTSKEVSGKDAMQAIITFANGCSSEETIEWLAPGDIQAKIIQENLSTGVQLQAKTTGDPDLFTYQWNTGASDSEILVTESGIYELTVTDFLGCSKVFTTEVEIDTPLDIYIPNAFSPNGDGINDYWGVFFADNQASIELVRIFDKWGSIIFQRRNIAATDAEQLWNGLHAHTNEIISDTVVYQIVIIENDLETVKTGVIVVVR